MIGLKKLLVGISVLASTLVLCTSLAFANGQRIGVVKGDDVNVRQSPSTDAKVLTQVSKDVQVTILEESDGWYKVTINNTTGWINGLFITVKASAQTGTITGDDVNMRESANTNSKILTTLSENAVVEVLEEADGWCKVKHNGTIGWVSRTYISIKDGIIALMTADDVNMRSEPSSDSKILTTLNEGTKVSVLDRKDDWYKVKTMNGTTGWVFKDFISVGGQKSSRGVQNVVNKATEKPVDKQPSTNDDDKNDADESDVVAYARKFLGVKYVYGGTSPNGFDCSGFVLYVYKKFGVSLNRVAADQATQGTRIKKADLNPGDLVFFDTNGGHNYVNHVGLYIGGGKFIHASSGSSSRKVVISDLTDGFYANAYMTARRVLK